MVQKYKISSIHYLNKFILVVLIIISMPINLNSKSKLPNRKDCSLVKENQVYNYYQRQEAYDFGRKIQTLVAKKDLKGIYKNILIEELQNGPRREFIKNKSFDQIFPEEWVKKITSSEISCDSVGWRGFMISHGLIWYEKLGKGTWTIKSINGANQEKFENKNLVGWKTNKGLLPPSCFSTFGYFKTPKVDLFSKKFDIKNKNNLRNSPGKYIGKTIPINYKIKPEFNQNYIYALTTSLNECFKWNLENGLKKKIEKNNNLVIKRNIVYQTKNIDKKETYDHLKLHYEVLSKVDLSKCNELAPQLSNCIEAYLIRIGYHTGGSIGWVGSYNIYGIFESKKEKYIVPLKVFANRNYALNELKKL